MTRAAVAAVWQRTRHHIDAELVWTSVSRVLVMLAGVASAIITARALDPAGRGTYFLATTTAQAIAQFGTVGLVSSNTYLLAANARLAGPLLGNSVCVSLVVGMGAAGAVMALAAPGAHFWWMLLLAPATLFWLLGTNLAVAQGRIRDYNRFQLAGNAAALLALALVATISGGATLFVAGIAVAWAAASVALLTDLRRNVSGPIVAFDGNVFRSGFAYSIRAYLVTIFGYLVLRSQVFILGGLRPGDELGHYSVAAQVADVLAILPQSAALLLFPQLVAMTSGRRPRTKEVAVHVGALLGVTCAIAWIAGPAILTQVFGEAYTPAGGILRAMLPGVMCLGLTTLLSQYLAASGMPGRLVLVWIVAAVVSLASGSWLIAEYGAHGAAWTYSLSQAVVLGGVCWLAWTTPLDRESPQAN